MIPETARQCMREIGLSKESAECVAALLGSSRESEAKQKLRLLRCELMDELHTCQRKVDRLDWLIREMDRSQAPDLPRRGICR